MNHPRKTPRAPWIDYDGGLFFITICTKNRIHYFGRIHDGEMYLSAIGKIVNEELQHPEIHHPEISIPLYVVMPNHIHAIVNVNPDMARHVPTSQRNPNPAFRGNPDMARHVPTSQRNPNPAFRGNPDMARHVPTLTKYVSSFKSAVSRMAHHISPDFGWQARYHDHLIRGNHDGNKISEYIINNPLNWNKDCFYE